MAGVSEGSDAFFRLGPAENSKARCFAVRRGEIAGYGISAAFYAPELRLFIDRLAKNPNTSGRLHDYVYINPKIDVSELESDSLVSFVPMDAVEDGIAGGMISLQRSLSEVQKGYTPFAEGDILWAKITPCMENGKSCIANSLTNKVGFGSTEFHVLRSYDSRLSQVFLWEFLSQETLRKAARYAFTGSAGHQRVPDSFLADLPFPLLPLDEQDRLVAAMNAARAERRAKLAEADALLAGLDDYLLAILGLTPPPKDERKVFAVIRKVAPPRFDPHFHLPAFAQILRLLAANGGESLGCVVKFSDEVWKPEKHESVTFRYIEISSVDTDTGEARAMETLVAEAPSRARMTVQINDIIVSLTRPHHGAIAQITQELDSCVASTGFAVIRNIDESRITRDYLWCILRTRMILSQMLQRASGGNYPAITESELAKVLIPIPDKDIQEIIAAETHRRREKPATCAPKQKPTGKPQNSGSRNNCWGRHKHCRCTPLSHFRLP